jgi:uncharacterized protein (TIGR02217 family)
MFLESPSFPEAIAYGAVGGPQFSTHVVESVAGYESRQQQWPLGPAVYDLSLTNRSAALTQALIAFFRCCAKGQAHGFRFRDFQPGEDRGTQEVLGYGNGTLRQFQLIKHYSIGGLAYKRTITKPVGETISVWFGETLLDPGSYSVDTVTGLLTFASPPPQDAIVRASYRFDVPVRFATDWLSITCIDPAPIYSWESIQLKEILPPLPPPPEPPPPLPPLPISLSVTERYEWIDSATTAVSYTEPWEV